MNISKFFNQFCVEFEFIFFQFTSLIGYAGRWSAGEGDYDGDLIFIFQEVISIAFSNIFNLETIVTVPLLAQRGFCTRF